MSVPAEYVTLTNSELNEVIGLLGIVEEDRQTIYNDGANNASIGIGLNLNLTAQNSLAAALQEMTFSVAPVLGGTTVVMNVFQAAAQIGLSIQSVLNLFTADISSNPLINGNSGSLAALQKALNTTLNALFFGYQSSNPQVPINFALSKQLKLWWIWSMG